MYRENSSQNKMSRIEKAKSGGFLDTWFGRPRNKSTSGYSSVRIPGSGNTSSYINTDGVSTGPSESGFENEDSHLSILEKLDEDALCQEFENMLNDMNLSEEKKEPLRLQPLDNKRKMVINQYKKKFQENKLKWDKPTDYITYLGQDPQSNKLYACMESLRIALKNNPLSWTEEFGTQGLKQVLNVLSDCYRNNEYHKVQLECLRCVTALMNNTKGVKTIFKLKESLHIVAKSLDPNQPNCMTETLKILAAISLLEDGHEKVLEAITAVSEIKAIPRFQSMIQALMSKHNEQLRTACFQLINALISQADDLDFRLHIRNEFMRTGLIDIIDTLKQDASADLTVQLNVFEDRKEDDYEEFCARFDHVRLEIEDVNDCFELIKNLTLETPAEPYFLSILQHLLFIRDDYNIRPAYFKLIEEAVTQIVLHKNGLDPDFQYKKKFEIDIQPLIDNLVEKEKFQAEESKKLEEMLARIEKEISLRQETEAKLAQAESRLEALGAGNIPVMNNVAAIAKNINIPPPPLMPGMGGPIPPPAPPVPPPMSGMCPPPPPLPGMGPPPPPLPGMGGPPPPPPFFGMPGAPPPPLLMKAPDILPHGLKPKKKWDTNGPLKRANWKAIIPQKMSDKAFWIRCQEDKLASPDILIGLAERFSSKPPVKKIDDVVDKSGTMKKIKDLKVLDGKAAQNISILLGGSLKHLSYDDVKTCILRCDDTVLGDNVLQQLIQYLPPPDQLKKLQEYKDKYNELTGAEQFCITIAEIKRLLPRLKSLSFRLHYTEMVQDIKPDIVAGTAACEEIKSSKKFAKLLELILLVGNYMNSGSKNGEAFGFEISFLTKLTGTKDFENKQTLLHYLVETIENKFSDILNFHDELSHVDKASRVSLDNIQKTLRQMESNIKNLETDLVNSKVPQSDDDKFNDIMALFAKEAREQCSVLQNMFKQMDSLYTDISEYYAFDKQKYTLEEFFTDIKTFKDAFINAHKDNIKLREQEEKSKRAKLSREIAEKEKHERALRKKQLVDMNAAQEGVMDSLLEALQTGSAFSREQKRKRGPRVAGAERRAQLNRSRSRSGLVGPSSLTRELSSELISA